MDNPGCSSMNPNSTIPFHECCHTRDGLLRQSSFVMGSGPGSCIRCATLGTVELLLHMSMHAHVHTQL